MHCIDTLAVHVAWILLHCRHVAYSFSTRLSWLLPVSMRWVRTYVDQ